MTSCGPYSQSNNFTSMTHIQDLRGSLPRKEYTRDSLTDIISRNQDFSKFKYILKLSKLDGIYNDPQANFTLFVPSDKELANVPEGVFTNMDDATARHIIQASTLRNRITGILLEDSPASYFVTMCRINKLFITNVNGETYVDSARVIQKDIECGNGIIHVIDRLIWPLMI
jgi:uncharacterized surface protein with fasciclin (FAS1) repeats